jgi:hypothetical protein
MRIGLVVGLGALLVASNSSASGLAYVRASSQLEEGADGKFQPLNLLDNNHDTLWCAAAGDDRPTIEIVFRTPTPIDEIRIVPARVGQTITRVRLDDGRHQVTLESHGQILAQALRPALAGPAFALTLLELSSSPAAGSARGRVCLADVLLFSRGVLFAGAAVPRFEPQTQAVLGGWSGGALGAPERRLTFALDGSWEWLFEPLLGGRGKRLSGEYRFRGGRLLMRQGEAGRWTDMGYRLERVHVDPEELGVPRADYRVLHLGEALGVDLAGDYNDARFE